MCECIGILSLNREQESFGHFFNLAEIVTCRRSCHIELKCIPRAFFLDWKSLSVVNLRQFVFTCKDIISVHEHATVVLLLKLSNLDGIKQVQGFLRNSFHIGVHLVFNNELTEFLGIAHVGNK